MGLTIPLHPELLAKLFSQLDTNLDGWLSFNEFNRFLNSLFQPQEQVLVETKKINVDLQPTGSEE